MEALPELFFRSPSPSLLTRMAMIIQGIFLMWAVHRLSLTLQNIPLAGLQAHSHLTDMPQEDAFSHNSIPHAGQVDFNAVVSISHIQAYLICTFPHLLRSLPYIII